MGFLKNLVGKISGAVPRYVEPTDESSLGRILVSAGRISDEQLKQVVVSTSRATEKLISDDLLNRGWVDADDVEQALDIQKKFMAGDELHARVAITKMKLADAIKAENQLSAEVKKTLPLLAAGVGALIEA